ncbi:hypothetical protein [Burkholderia cenocepacia]|uniref:hypothetical protein n=1 Tax=Burkholderia cenocepacia TaxID=95486 RepID=UPI00264F362D|nr:hypothetical protein [Burkholderia cenocepacia]MDN7537021.1 hypothetical protein [Burkholderia cenocepacia]
MTAPARYHGRKVEVIQRMCAHKNRYPDELTARAAGAHYVTLGQVSALWVYRCPICNGFHLTSQQQGKRQNAMYGLPTPKETAA